MPTTAAAPIGSPSIACTDEDLFRALRGASAEQTQQIHALLVSRHRGLVGWLASRYAGRGPSVDELRQVGYLGLMLAIRRFDVERGCHFITFARPTVQGEIQRHFRDQRRWIRLPRRLQEMKAALQVAEAELAQTLRRWPSIAELAAALLITKNQAREALAAPQTYELASLDSPLGASALGAEGDESFTVTDTIGDSDPRIDQLIDYHSVRPLIAELPERERHILYLRFFEEKTQAQIGQELGVSQMQVSRLLARTLSALRVQMQADHQGPSARVPGRPAGPAVLRSPLSGCGDGVRAVDGVA